MAPGRPPGPARRADVKSLMSKLRGAPRRSKRNGEAYVEFGSAEDAAKALKERQHEHLGSRYIECAPLAAASPPVSAPV